jgi:hypothetical protein
MGKKNNNNFKAVSILGALQNHDNINVFIPENHCR